MAMNRAEAVNDEGRIGAKALEAPNNAETLRHVSADVENFIVVSVSLLGYRKIIIVRERRASLVLRIKACVCVAFNPNRRQWKIRVADFLVIRLGYVNGKQLRALPY
jgi:hypothetical protein